MTGLASAVFDLQAALAQHPLPEGVPDADMSLDELAAAMNVSTNTTSKWAKRDGMPVIEEGGPGRAYVVRLSEAWAWREWSQAQEAKRSSAAQAATHALQQRMLDLPDMGPSLTHKDLRGMAEASMVWNQARKDKGELCEVADVTALLDDLVEVIREGLATLPDVLERELGLNPDQVRAVERAGRDIVADLHQRIAAAELAGPDMASIDAALA